MNHLDDLSVKSAIVLMILRFELGTLRTEVGTQHTERLEKVAFIPTSLSLKHFTISSTL